MSFLNYALPIPSFGARSIGAPNETPPTTSTPTPTKQEQPPERAAEVKSVEAVVHATATGIPPLKRDFNASATDFKGGPSKPQITKLERPAAPVATKIPELRAAAKPVANIFPASSNPPTSPAAPMAARPVLLASDEVEDEPVQEVPVEEDAVDPDLIYNLTGEARAIILDNSPHTGILGFTTIDDISDLDCEVVAKICQRFLARMVAREGLEGDVQDAVIMDVGEVEEALEDPANQNLQVLIVHESTMETEMALGSDYLEDEDGLDDNPESVIRKKICKYELPIYKVDFYEEFSVGTYNPLAPSASVCLVILPADDEVLFKDVFSPELLSSFGNF